MTVCNSINFIVVEEDLIPLLGMETACKMKLIDVKRQNMEIVAAVSSSESKFDEKYNPLWDEKIGKFEGEVHLETDPDVKPVIMPAKRIPASLKEKLLAELQRRERLGVIASVDEPTPWVNQIAITEKNLELLEFALTPSSSTKLSEENISCF